MTEGYWICLVCKHCLGNPFNPVHIDEVILTCPKCKAEYELVETIKPHPFHSVHITRLKGTSKLNVIRPIVIGSFEGFKGDFNRYMEIVGCN